MEVLEGNKFCQVSLMNSGLSCNYGAMVVAIERKGNFILNPSARIVFEENDVVWFVCSEASMEKLKKKAKKMSDAEKKLTPMIKESHSLS